MTTNSNSSWFRKSAKTCPSQQEHISFGLQKLSQKPMDTSVPWMARAYRQNLILGKVGWCSSTFQTWRNYHLMRLNLLIFPFLEHSPCLWNVAVSKSDRSHWCQGAEKDSTASVLQLLMGSQADCLLWTEPLWSSDTLGLVPWDKTPIWWGAAGTEEVNLLCLTFPTQASCCMTAKTILKESLIWKTEEVGNLLRC